MAISAEDLVQLVNTISTLIKRLPPTIPEGTREDKIFKVMTGPIPKGEPHHETFNRRFDALFGEDCRDHNGRLQHIRRGRAGMMLVTTYLTRIIDKDDVKKQAAIVAMKLERIKSELEYLCENAGDTRSSLGGIDVAGEDLDVPAPAEGLGGSEAAQRTDAGQDTEEARKDRDATAVDKGTIERDASPIRQSARRTETETESRQRVKQSQLPKAQVSVAKRKRAVKEESTDTSTDTRDAGPGIDDEDGPRARDKTKRKRREQGAKKVSKTYSGKWLCRELRRPRDVEVGGDANGAQKKRVRRSSSGGYKRPTRPKKTSKKSATTSRNTVSDESTSDGETALRDVQAKEAAARSRGPNGARGPKNLTLPHWHEAKAIIEGKGKRWEFGCRTRTVKRNVDSRFEDEPLRPPLNNLAKHTSYAHADKLKEAKSAPADAPPATTEPGTHGYTAASAQLMDKWLAEGDLNPLVEPTRRGFLRLFSAWIFDEDLPFTTGEAPRLRELFKYLKINYVLPSDTTVRNTLAHIFAELHSAVVKELAAVKSKIAYSTDTWSTPQMMFTFAGTLAHFINDDWELVERLVDFKHLDIDEHKGVHAAKAFVKSASQRGGLNKISTLIIVILLSGSLLCGPYIISVTMDNASANDVLARTLGRLLLQRYGINFETKNAQIRCLAHVVNLVVQKILSDLDEADDPEAADYFVLNKFMEFHYDPKDDEELQDLEAEGAAEADELLCGDLDIPELVENDDDDDDEYEDDADEEEEVPGVEASEDDEEEQPRSTAKGRSKKGKKKKPKKLTVVQKLRKIVRKIVSSPQRRTIFRRHAHKFYDGKKTEDGGKCIAELMPIRDVKTRWNWTHAMIQRALIMRKAITAWVMDHDKLHHLLLTSDDWYLLEQLESLLVIFTEVTRAMSMSRTPTLPYVLPMYEHMRTSLVDTIETTAERTVKRAAQAGLEKLMQYYEKARQNESCIIATACHPALRLSWFNCLAPQHQVKAISTFKKVYTKYEASTPTAQDVPLRPVAAAKSGSLMSRLSSNVELGSADQPPVLSELQRWQAGEGGKGDPDFPLVWWKAHAQDFKVISRIARDYLAIPGASVSVERLFSASRHLCANTRSSLKAETIVQALCAKIWLRANLLKLY
ncbi:hypothetical protein EVJ58_g4726 [Rhodofomes roseus]|uniref:HAT C-terminal dimerisation domain-containing protein n=1 Tax=Rhodofomes roseus TaxID=34475 RepID=A0A4Y9YHM6_9APHY|nr:hypothetical protein EVJ58_g4726 [Rhodofomes roseus]